MFTTHTERGLFATILVALTLALGIVYIVLSVKDQSPAPSQDNTRISHISQVEGTAVAPRPFSLDEFYDPNEPAVMEPSDMYAVRENVSDALQQLKANTNWDEELSYLSAQAPGRTTDSYLRVLTTSNDVTDTQLTSGQSIREYLNGRDARMTNQLIVEVVPEFGEFVAALSYEYDVARPYLLDTSVRTNIPERFSGPSFPSVSAAQLYLVTFILAELDPENNQAYATAAEQYAADLLEQGLHYRVDTVAAKLVANAYLDTLAENTSYQTLYRAAVQEWDTTTSN